VVALCSGFFAANQEPSDHYELEKDSSSVVALDLLVVMARGDTGYDRRNVDAAVGDPVADLERIGVMATFAGCWRISNPWNGHEDGSSRRQTTLDLCRRIHQGNDREMANEPNDLCFSHADVDVYRDNLPLLANDPSSAA
jgi:hypothetical protein